MSTLTEIENAADQLPPEEQEKLLHHLTAALRRRKSVPSSSIAEDWMKRLDALRASVGSGQHTLASDQILTDSREGRDWSQLTAG